MKGSNVKALYTITAFSAVFLTSCGSPESEELTVEGVMKPAGGEVARVDVFDGCGAPAAAAEVVEELKAAGYAVGEVLPARDAAGWIDYSYDATVVRYGPAGAEDAENVAGILGDATTEPGSGLTDTLEIFVSGRAEDPTGAPDDGFYIDLSEKVLYYFDDGVRAAVYPCAPGKPETPTPTGTFSTGGKSVDPTWYWEGKAIPPGPENGLGTRFIAIANDSYPRGYGIHGTNEPESIGTAASHGCIRMYNEDVEALYPMVDAGETVVIVE
ncbi:MAG: L,D-transpeptidase family protein [Candidatus Coatesbacteria bacterium]|nr:MAG: L,D-transpeptidase family protein [Candidatus Coatesbacteria bacterium]